MKVKQFKEILAKYKDEQNIVIVSSSGITWELNDKVPENPKEKDKQVIIYIK